MAKPFPLPALRAFHHAARTASFRQAAEEIGVTPSAVSHQIRGLEAASGVRLFRRVGRAVELTEEGAAIWSKVRRAFEILDDASNDLRQQAEDRTLRVSALPFFTNVCLIPRLGAFQAAHPGIDLVVETANRLADFDRDPIDIGIRNLRTPPRDLTSMKLVDLTPVPICTPGLLRGKQALRVPADLAGHTLIRVSARPDSWPRWLAAAGVPDLKPANELWFDTVPDALRAAANGLGVALGMAPLVWASDVAGELAAPFGVTLDSEYGYYLVHRRDDDAKPKIKAFKTWIEGEMADLGRAAPPRPASSRQG